MAKVTFTPDHAGFAQVLKSPEVKAMVHDAAVKIAGSVRQALPEGTDVAVDDYTTDRAASSVTIRDVQGKLFQARDGVLTRAAAANGAEVKAK